MWGEAIQAFSKQFEDVCGKWILLTKYTTDVYRGNIFPPGIFPTMFQILYFFLFIKVLLVLNSTKAAASAKLIKMMRELSLERKNFLRISLPSWTGREGRLHQDRYSFSLKPPSTDSTSVTPVRRLHLSEVVKWRWR